MSEGQLDVQQALPEETGERVAAYTATSWRGYESRLADEPDTPTWVQVDLGATRRMDAVRLYPSHSVHYPGNGFPLRFRIECADEPDFKRPRTIADRAAADYPDPGDRVVEFRTLPVEARYVRLTALRLRKRRAPDLPIKSVDVGPAFLLSLAKLSVLFDGEDLALLRPVAVDSLLGCERSAQQLTRALRPMGEDVVTDHPENVTRPTSWHPKAFRAETPRAGVTLHGGLFAKAIGHNIDYLLSSAETGDLLRQFQLRAGKPAPPPTREPSPFWEEELAGSSAGRFLMGAGNVLRWVEHAELRERTQAVIDGIADCRAPNGYIMAYPEDRIFFSELGAYARAWVTHGLIEAGYAGYPKAFELLRGYYDWYNASPHLPRLRRSCNHGGIGMVANTRLYFTPAGLSMDLQIIQRYFEESYWLDALARRDPECIWQYPYDRPHCFLLTTLEAYLDLYRATGELRYIEAVDGAWELFRENWQSTGGSLSIIETETCPPKSNRLHAPLGETCGSVFWILLNQRLHSLRPGEEKYVAEIERSIYNVLLANQDGARGIRYHAMLTGQKEASRSVNTCCEGQGTRVLGSLPEYIYSIAADGLYVNLFEPSAIEWHHAGERIKVRLLTTFPLNREVTLRIEAAARQRLKLYVRIPSWASDRVPVRVNGTEAAQGRPGAYLAIERAWSAGDTISFVLPIAPKLTLYTGGDRIAGRERFALEYGPLLMAAVGLDSHERILLTDAAGEPSDLLARLQPEESNAIHLQVRSFGLKNARFIPYHEVAAEAFTCFPFIESRTGIFHFSS